MIKAVIFDFDGVLVESVNIKTEAFGKLFLDRGGKIAGQVVMYHLKNTGVSRFDKIKYIYRNILHQKLPERELRSLCRRFSALVYNEVINAPLVLGAGEFLSQYKGRYNFFICSATPQQELKKIIAGRQMGKYFKKVYGAPLKKEDIVKKIIRDNKLSAKEVIYVGDAQSDYRAAKANSVTFVARINGYGGFKDCFKIKDLLNLKAVVEKAHIK